MDHEFIGLKPKSPAGRSIVFASLDWWIEINNCISMVCFHDFPAYPEMDNEAAVAVAETIEERIAFGIVKAYFELSVAKYQKANGEHYSNKTIAADVAQLLALTKQYVDFLKNCGGCASANN